MPESFDSMLAELADVAAAATVPPGIAEIRRRARQRTTQRRLTASALAFALVGVAGGAWAFTSHHYGTNSSVAPMSGSSATSAPSSSAPAATPAASGASGAYEFSYGADVSLWKTVAQGDGYLMVFSDGVVAMSTAKNFPLCYGQLGSASSASPSSVVIKSSQTLVDVSCDSVGLTGRLSLAPGPSGDELLFTEPASSFSGGYTQTYSRQPFGDGATLASVPSGKWMAVDGTNRTLVVATDGSISYTEYRNGGKPYTGAGLIDAYYGSAVRAVINCSSGGAVSPCGVLLLEPSPKPGEIVVFSSYGAETFMHQG